MFYLVVKIISAKIYTNYIENYDAVLEIRDQEMLSRQTHGLSMRLSWSASSVDSVSCFVWLQFPFHSGFTLSMLSKKRGLKQRRLVKWVMGSEAKRSRVENLLDGGGKPVFFCFGLVRKEFFLCKRSIEMIVSNGKS